MSRKDGGPDRNLDVLKAEMAEPRLAASVRSQFVSDDQQTIELAGFGNLQAVFLPHRQFRVEYALKLAKETPVVNNHTPAELVSRCTECMIESVNEVVIPDGDYLLHLDHDGVHHVRKIDAQWAYLTIPSKT